MAAVVVMAISEAGVASTLFSAALTVMADVDERINWASFWLGWRADAAATDGASGANSAASEGAAGGAD